MPSFSAWDSAGKMTFACSRSPSVRTEAWATTRPAECSARSQSARFGQVADRVGLHEYSAVISPSAAACAISALRRARPSASGA